MTALRSAGCGSSPRSWSPGAWNRLLATARPLASPTGEPVDGLLEPEQVDRGPAPLEILHDAVLLDPSGLGACRYSGRLGGSDGHDAAHVGDDHVARRDQLATACDRN